MNRHKVAIFLLLAGVMVLLFVLAAGLSQVKLLPGQPFSIPDLSLGEHNAQASSSGIDLMQLVIRGVLAISIVLAPFALIFMLFSKRGRKQLAVMLITTLIILFFLMMLNRVVPQEASDTAEEPPSAVETIAEEGEVIEPPESVISPPDWATWAASLVIAAVLAAISVAFVRLFLRRRDSSDALGRLAEEAQDALDRLEMGEDLRETILRCYREMIQVVRETRGIVREQSVTPREFEALLKMKGLPSESLLRLTQLFEETRYGSHLSSSQEEQLAILCLRDIAAACQEGKPYES